MRAFFVFGAEDSGSKAWARAILAASEGGREEHATWFEAPVWEPGLNLVVHRSFPYGGDWPGVNEVVADAAFRGLEAAGAVVVTRSWWPQVQAQLHRARVVDQDQALRHIQEALTRIYVALTTIGLRTVTVAYEDGGRGLEHTLRWLGLDPVPFEFWDGNAHWYRGATETVTSEP